MVAAVEQVHPAAGAHDERAPVRQPREVLDLQQASAPAPTATGPSATGPSAAATFATAAAATATTTTTGYAAAATFASWACRR